MRVESSGPPTQPAINVIFGKSSLQVRNIKDTNLKISGENVTKWMEIAQCFAGPPEDPPEPGSRTWNNTNELHSI